MVKMNHSMPLRIDRSNRFLFVFSQLSKGEMHSTPPGVGHKDLWKKPMEIRRLGTIQSWVIQNGSERLEMESSQIGSFLDDYITQNLTPQKSFRISHGNPGVPSHPELVESLEENLHRIWWSTKSEIQRPNSVLPDASCMECLPRCGLNSMVK